jgi:hypothetical protein
LQARIKSALPSFLCGFVLTRLAGLKTQLGLQGLNRPKCEKSSKSNLVVLQRQLPNLLDEILEGNISPLFLPQP